MDLKPCPFCGSTDIQIVSVEGGEVAGRCEDCFAYGPGPCYSTDEARETWNRRAALTEAREEADLEAARRNAMDHIHEALTADELPKESDLHPTVRHTWDV